MSSTESAEWKKTACIICALNCGLEVQTKGPRIIRIRADKEHPISHGYLCEKAQRMDYYQNGADRLSSPMRRRADGRYEAIDWDTAIREIAEKFAAIKFKHGGESILYYGGGSQGNHLGGTYADSTTKALGIQYRSNALAQEKTGEAWVQGKMMGSGVHCDFEHAEVAVFLGKNPWQSHGFARSRVILRDMQKDPNRSIIVIDPCKTETAAMADYHLAVKPGTDAWCLTAMAAIIVQEGLAPADWHAEHTTGLSDIVAVLRRISILRYAQICGVDEALLRSATRRIAHAKSVSMLEDLGVQMNIHSTLNSYLNRLVWLLTGHYGRPGTNNAFVPFINFSYSGRDQAKKASKSATGVPKAGRTSPVTGSKVIMGLIPCNVIPEEILTDHPKRFRAMFIESSNPVHSLADSQKMREALRALELSVVIDVAMTETAQQADYVLPASSAFEKAEATFFNIEVPRNGFHLRQPLFEQREGTLTEAEIHARLVEALGAVGPAQYGFLRKAAGWGLLPYALAFGWKSMRDKRVARNAPVVLYRTLGPHMPKGMAAGASLWGICQMYVRQQPQAAARAGFGGHPILAANRLFKAIVGSPSGVIYADTEYSHSWKAVRLPGQRINLWIPELLPEIEKLAQGGPAVDAQYPFVLSAGERRTETSNTTFRDSSWHKKGPFGTLRMCPQDAAALGCQAGEWVRVTTRRGSADAEVELSEALQSGHVSLPNGLGLDYRRADGVVERKGVPLNELTGVTERDPIAGTPWHKRVPARIERIPTSAPVSA
ncbi:molybdopterin-dependent oxidoreductase [Rhodoferax sp. UBA5149]|uniref:molybdopterin-dependent oxidoreductase n=1 Tax=Rhodoferax sp. UBA5149 TaxID=1947379 RepID=UPI0025D35907|nr:molybdopterin-dependent oxidoreductase [Rhodoferax sp. UBA5149]